MSMPISCDLLENIYLCGINNNSNSFCLPFAGVVICLKISIFVASTTTIKSIGLVHTRCDLLENIYLCGINNNLLFEVKHPSPVVICLKISTFVVSTTTQNKRTGR